MWLEPTPQISERVPFLLSLILSGILCQRIKSALPQEEEGRRGGTRRWKSSCREAACRPNFISFFSRGCSLRKNLNRNSAKITTYHTWARRGSGFCPPQPPDPIVVTFELYVVDPPPSPQNSRGPCPAMRHTFTFCTLFSEFGERYSFFPPPKKQHKRRDLGDLQLIFFLKKIFFTSCLVCGTWMPAVRPAQGGRRGGPASRGSGESTTARGPGRPGFTINYPFKKKLSRKNCCACKKRIFLLFDNYQRYLTLSLIMLRLSTQMAFYKK